MTPNTQKPPTNDQEGRESVFSFQSNIAQFTSQYLPMAKLTPDGTLAFYRATSPKTRESYLAGEVEEVDRLEYDREEQLDSLSSSDVSNPHRRNETYGLNGLTSYAKKMIRCSAALLSRKYTNRRVLFGTLTLPEYQPNVLRAMCENWHHMIRTFFQWYKRRLISKGLEPYYCYVTEIQEKRSVSREDLLAIPHCHWIGLGKNEDGSFVWTADEIKKEWDKVCFTYAVKIATKLDISTESVTKRGGRIHLSITKKSVAAYLSKYLSKGNKKNNTDDIMITNYRNSMISCTWWGMSNSMRKWINEETYYFSDTFTAEVSDMVSSDINDKSKVRWAGELQMINENGITTICRVLHLSEKYYIELVDRMKRTRYS